MNTTQAEPCPHCGGARGPGETTFSVEFGSGILVVRHVPATVCTQCGAHWLSDEVAAHLEERAAQARQKHTQVEVTAYA